MSKKIVQELEELSSAGIIDIDTAARIKNYYAGQDTQNDGGKINLLFAIIGTVLVSLGIILIVAHNWHELTRPVRLFFAFLPLAIGQGLCGFTLYKKMGNTGFKESAAVFLFFAAGACLALVSQLYHISETTADILFMWMLIGFPIIYIMQSSVTSLLYICGITVYAVSAAFGVSASNDHYWWMLLLVAPHYFMLLTKKAGSNFSLFHNWFIPLSLTICLATSGRNAHELLFVAYMSLFGIFYMVGTSPYFSRQKIFNHGYLVLGSLGTIILLLTFSFRPMWEEIHTDLIKKIGWQTTELWFALVISLIGLALLIKQLKNHNIRSINYMGFIFLFFIGLFFLRFANVAMATLLTNVLVLAAGIFTIQRGNHLNHLGILNFGLLVITALVICRFFDTDLSFVFRGGMFIAVGAGFFIANKSLLNKRTANGK